MNKEERKAIEYYQDKEISFGVNFDTEKLLRALGIIEEDSFENHQIRFKTLLNLIEKLQKENEELKEIYRSEKKMKNEYIKLYQDLLLKENIIPIQKVKDKIEEILNNGEYRIIFEGDAEFPDEATRIDAQKYIKLEKLQELIEGRK